MSELQKIATLHSEVQHLQSQYETCVDDRQVERYQLQDTIDSLNQTLWETEAALGDAEREILFVKNTAITAIRKLGCAIRERDQLRLDLQRATQENADQASRLESMQRHLIVLSRKFRSRSQTSGHAKQVANKPSAYAREEDATDWCLVHTQK